MRDLWARADVPPEDPGHDRTAADGAHRRERCRVWRARRGEVRARVSADDQPRCRRAIRRRRCRNPRRSRERAAQSGAVDGRRGFFVHAAGETGRIRTPRAGRRGSRQLPAQQPLRLQRQRDSTRCRIPGGARGARDADRSLIEAMLDLSAAFAPDYAQAREKFEAAAAARSLDVERNEHPTARGAQGEALSLDVAVLGDADAPTMLLLTSGVHGVEGFCGSGCQVALLREESVYRTLAASGVAVVFCHAVNPYGFSHLRRGNEDNVDVNRNFRDFRQPLAQNSAYASLHATLVPDDWPPNRGNTEALTASAARHGLSKLQAIITGGQSEFADGLFYTGRSPSWSNTTLRGVLERQGQRRRAIGWIDFHTGLGPWGYGEKIYSGPDDAASIARAKAWYGIDVTTFYDGTSTSAHLTGVAYH